MKNHSKTPGEALCLETGMLQIRYFAMQRRLMHLHNILKEPENELLRKVYEIQKLLPTMNDWYQMVQEAKNNLGLAVSDEQISEMSKENLKIIVVEPKKVCSKLP